MPEPLLERVLAAHIARICRALGCAPHGPHVTVLGNVGVDRVLAEQTVGSVAPLTPPLVLQPRAVATSPLRFEALTVRFEPSSAFDLLTAELRRRLSLPQASVGDIHLSLTYPKEPFDPSGLRPLAEGVPLTRPYRFDRLALISAGPGRRDWQDVAGWQRLTATALETP